MTPPHAAAARARSVPGDPTASALDGRVDSAPLNSSLAGTPRLDRIIRMFNERLAQRLDSVAGVEDLAELAELAHWLKGSAGSVGYEAFTEPAAALEQRARAGDAEGAEVLLRQVRQLAARIERVPG